MIFWTNTVKRYLRISYVVYEALYLVKFIKLCICLNTCIVSFTIWKTDKFYKISIIIALAFLEPIGEIVWLICWNGCAYLYMCGTVWELKDVCMYSECNKACGYSFTLWTAVQHQSFLRKHIFSHSTALLWWTSSWYGQKVSQINREVRNNFWHVEACALESFSCHRIFLDISKNIEFNDKM